jgi:hypothetical protein
MKPRLNTIGAAFVIVSVSLLSGCVNPYLTATPSAVPTSVDSKNIVPYVLTARTIGIKGVCDGNKAEPPKDMFDTDPTIKYTALTSSSPADFGDPSNAGVVCEIVQAGKGAQKFGILIAPPNSVTYQISPVVSPRKQYLVFKGTVGDQGLSNTICRGEVSFAAIAFVGAPVLPGGIWIPILAPTKGVSGGLEETVKIPLPAGATLIKIYSFTGAFGSNGDRWCDHAFIAEPWLIDAPK